MLTEFAAKEYGNADQTNEIKDKLEENLAARKKGFWGGRVPMWAQSAWNVVTR